MSQLDDLISEGATYNFQNNSYYSYDSYYSKATTEFLTWVSKVEDYIRSNYDENSGPYKMIESLNREMFSGNYESQFDKELTKLKGAINSCKIVAPNKTKKKEDNAIIALIKNPIFWTVLVVGLGSSYKLGYDNGNSKFDKEKIELNKENELLNSSNNELKTDMRAKDSIIIELKAKLK